MNDLTKWDPFKDWDPFHELSEFQNRLSSVFGRSLPQKGQAGAAHSLWSPPVDIIEDDKEFGPFRGIAVGRWRQNLGGDLDFRYGA